MNKNQKFIPIARPWFDERENEAVLRPLQTGWVTQGPEVKAFEDEFATYVGAEHAVAVSSCTTALFLALKAVGVRSGDEVITVSHSFLATANSIRYHDAIPVFVDVEKGSENIDPHLLERNITPKTRAILCVHQIGIPCKLDEILTIARKHNLPLIEDAACAAGSEIHWDQKWEMIGKPHGDIACFSFHPRKILTTGDGGMLTTDNAEFDEKFRLWRQHSMGVSDTKRHSSDKVLCEDYLELGYNYRMTDIQASIGRVQLRKLPEMVQRRRDLVKLYRELLVDIEAITILEEPSWAKNNWQSFGVRIKSDVSQNESMQRLLDCGIATRRGIQNCHREPVYQTEPWICNGKLRPYDDNNNCSLLKNSELAQDKTIFLPLFHQLKEEDVEYISQQIKRAFQ